MSPTSLIIEDDQAVMKLLHCCFTSSLLANFLTTINIVNVFLAFLSFRFLIYTFLPPYPLPFVV